MDLSQLSTDALNSYGQLLLDKDIAIRIVLFIPILQNKRYHVCHDRFMKLKMNRYSKSDEIHVGLGVT